MKEKELVVRNRAFGAVWNQRYSVKDSGTLKEIYSSVEFDLMLLLCGFLNGHGFSMGLIYITKPCGFLTESMFIFPFL